ARARARTRGPRYRDGEGDVRDGRARGTLIVRRSHGRLAATVVALALAAPALAGCGGSGDPKIKVSAASSLTDAFDAYAQTLRTVKVGYSFAGSDELAAQIDSLEDLRKPGTTIAVGSATVPVGKYTETVLARLEPARRMAIAKNIRDREPNVSGIVGKLSEWAVGAGFLDATDVKADDGEVEAIALPASLQPNVAYGIAVVNGTW